MEDLKHFFPTPDLVGAFESLEELCCGTICKAASYSLTPHLAQAYYLSS